jgi:disulfide bond formation protein DsbB
MAKQQDSGFFTYRTLHFLGFVLSTSAVAIAATVYESTLSDIECAACTTVRLMLLLMAAIHFLAWLINPWKGLQRFFGILLSIGSVIGLVVTGRYLWVSPDSVSADSECSLVQDNAFGFLPNQLIEFFQTQSDCLYQSSSVSGISLDIAALILLVVLAVIHWRILTRNPRQRVSLF